MNARRRSRAAIAALLVSLAMPSIAAAQARRPRPAPARQQPRSRSVQIGGYAMVGTSSFTARESFDAILDKASGPIVGGGARIGIPYGGLFADIGAWRFSDTGERVFV